MLRPEGYKWDIGNTPAWTLPYDEVIMRIIAKNGHIYYWASFDKVSGKFKWVVR